jgi:hypothetical protein
LRTKLTTTCEKRCAAFRCSLLAAAVRFASAAEIGQVKDAKGQVDVERKGQTMPRKSGCALETADV